MIHSLFDLLPILVIIFIGIIVVFIYTKNKNVTKIENESLVKDYRIKTRIKKWLLEQARFLFKIFISCIFISIIVFILTRIIL